MEEPKRIRCVFKAIGERARLIEIELQRGVFQKLIDAQKIRTDTFWRDDSGRIMVLYDDEHVSAQKPKNVKDPSIKFGFHAFYGTLVFVRTNHADEVVSLDDNDARSTLYRVDEFAF